MEIEAKANPLSIVTLACNRTLSSSAKVQIVFGKGVATPARGGTAAGVPNSVEKRFNFQVREPFAATFSCERENAQSACLPIRPMTLNFNAPVPVKLSVPPVPPEAVIVPLPKPTLKRRSVLCGVVEVV